MWLGGQLALSLLLMIATGPRATARDSSPVLLAAASSPSPIGELLRNLAIFLVLSAVGGSAWYFGLFPRLLRKNLCWPLDAWRLASYGAWLTACAALLVFRDQFYREVLIPLLTRLGLHPLLILWIPVVVVLPLIALVGLLVIWNFRRDESNRARPN